MSVRHYYNLSKHKIKEKKNLLKLTEYLIKTYCGLPQAKVELPLTQPWDGVIVIPNASLAQVAAAVEAYYEITQEELLKALEALGLPNEPPYNEVPIASSSYNEITASLENYTPYNA